MFFGFFGNSSSKKKKKLQVSAVARQVEISPSTIFRIMKNIKYPSLLLFQSLMILWNQKKAVPTNLIVKATASF